MFALVSILAVCLGDGAMGTDAYYSKYPAPGYYPTGHYVRPQVKYIYRDVPQYFGSGEEAAHDYHEHEDSKKTTHEDEHSSLHAAHGAEGDHYEVVDNSGKHGFDEAATGHKSTGEDLVLSEKVKEYGTSSKGGYGGHAGAGYQKGHKTTGFQKTYHKEESGKDHHYVDEDHTTGGEEFAKSQEGQYGEKGREGYTGADGGAGYKYMSAGHRGEGSGISSAASHGSALGHRGSESSRRGAVVSSDLAGSKGHRVGGHNFARYEPVY